VKQVVVPKVRVIRPAEKVSLVPQAVHGCRSKRLTVFERKRLLDRTMEETEVLLQTPARYRAAELLHQHAPTCLTLSQAIVVYRTTLFRALN